MNLAEQVALYQSRGLTRNQAEIVALMRLAAGTLFRRFPESFLLFGGATLLFFHNSVRHSGDLDLLSTTEPRPTAAAIEDALASGIAPPGEILGFAPLRFEDVSAGESDTKLWVVAGDGRRLFRVDLNQFGSVLASEIEEHIIALDDERVATVQSASANFLLLQKAECFLLRKIVKTRDAFDIRLLQESGAALDNNLKQHLADTLSSWEVEVSYILNRIEQVNEARCASELRTVLPRAAFEALLREGFKPLRDSLFVLFADWLS